MTVIRKVLDHRTLVIVGLLAVALLAGPVTPLDASSAAAGVTGFGFWETLTCIACITGFVVGAGTTIAGLAVFLAANPEIAILCVGTCTLAAS